MTNQPILDILLLQGQTAVLAIAIKITDTRYTLIPETDSSCAHYNNNDHVTNQLIQEIP